MSAAAADREWREREAFTRGWKYGNDWGAATTARARDEIRHHLWSDPTDADVEAFLQGSLDGEVGDCTRLHAGQEMTAGHECGPLCERPTRGQVTGEITAGEVQWSADQCVECGTRNWAEDSAEGKPNVCVGCQEALCDSCLRGGHLCGPYGEDG